MQAEPTRGDGRGVRVRSVKRACLVCGKPVRVGLRYGNFYSHTAGDGATICSGTGMSGGVDADGADLVVPDLGRSVSDPRGGAMTPDNAETVVSVRAVNAGLPGHGRRRL